MTSRKSSVSRDFILLFAVLMAVIALVALWVAYKTFESYADSIVTEMESEAVRIDRSVIVEIQAASYILESLARQIVQIGADDPKGVARLLSSFYDSNSNRKNEYAWLNTDQEIIISSSGGILSKPIPADDRDFVKKSLAAPWQVHIGRPIHGHLSERWILPLSLGVTDYQGTFAGIIMLSIDIGHLTDELKDVVKASSMQFAIFTKTLTPITHSDQEQQSGQGVLEHSTRLTLDDVDTQERAILSKPQLFNPSEHFSYFEASSQYPYIVYITYNQSNHQERINSLLRVRMSEILMISVFLLALLWMVRTRIIHPVEKLSEMTAGIATGNAYTPLPRGGPLEIEYLANQIRKLSDYINEQYRIQQDLKLKNQFLTKMKESVQVLTRARSEFLSNISVELGKPLKRLQGELGNLLEHQRNPSAIQSQPVDLLAEAIHLTQTMQQMIEDMGHIAEEEYSHVHLRDSSVNVSFAVHRAIRQLHDLPHYRHVEVKLKIDDNLPILLIDEERFTQIMVNLLSGASAHLMQGSTIELSAHIELNEQVTKELVIHIKYTTNLLLPASDLAPSPHDSKSGDTPPSPSYGRARSDVICFALAQMLVSIYEAEMTVSSGKHDTSHIYLRFPQSRLIE